MKKEFEGYDTFAFGPVCIDIFVGDRSEYIATSHRHVGLSGLFIDIAVADPERPGRYVLGVELDGLSYANAQSARDRDRLRNAVLRDHGWQLHRIWAMDWLQRPAEQAQKLLQRDRSLVNSPGLRRIEMLPPVEIDAGILSVIEASMGGAAEQIFRRFRG